MLGNAFGLVFAPDHEAGDVLQEQQRNLALATQLDEVRALLGRFGKQHAVVGNDAHRHAFDVRKTGDQRGAVARLELVELGAVDDARDDLVNVVRLARVGRDHAVQLARIEQRRTRLDQALCVILAPVQVCDRSPRNRQRVHVVLRQMIGHAGQARVHVATAQVFGADDLANGRLHQRRAGQEDRALVLDDDRLIAHRRHVGAACRARAHHHGNLRDALGAHVGLVEEDAAEVLAVRKHVVLVRQIGAAAVDQIDAGQAVLLRDLLRAQVLLDRHRVVAAALHGGVVADDHAVDTTDPADAGNQAGAGGVVLVHVERGEWRHFEERGVGVEQHFDPVAWQQLAALQVLGAGRVAAALNDLQQPRVQVVDQCAHGGRVGLEIFSAGIELGSESGHGVSEGAVARWPSAELTYT